MKHVVKFTYDNNEYQLIFSNIQGCATILHSLQQNLHIDPPSGQTNELTAGFCASQPLFTQLQLNSYDNRVKLDKIQQIREFSTSSTISIQQLQNQQIQEINKIKQQSVNDNTTFTSSQFKPLLSQSSVQNKETKESSDLQAIANELNMTDLISKEIGNLDLKHDQQEHVELPEQQNNVKQIQQQLGTSIQQNNQFKANGTENQVSDPSQLSKPYQTMLFLNQNNETLMNQISTELGIKIDNFRDFASSAAGMLSKLPASRQLQLVQQMTAGGELRERIVGILQRAEKGDKSNEKQTTPDNRLLQQPLFQPSRNLQKQYTSPQSVIKAPQQLQAIPIATTEFPVAPNVFVQPNTNMYNITTQNAQFLHNAPIMNQFQSQPQQTVTIIPPLQQFAPRQPFDNTQVGPVLPPILQQNMPLPQRQQSYGQPLVNNIYQQTIPPLQPQSAPFLSQVQSGYPQIIPSQLSSRNISKLTDFQQQQLSNFLAQTPSNTLKQILNLPILYGYNITQKFNFANKQYNLIKFREDKRSILQKNQNLINSAVSAYDSQVDHDRPRPQFGDSSDIFKIQQFVKESASKHRNFATQNESWKFHRSFSSNDNLTLLLRVNQTQQQAKHVILFDFNEVYLESYNHLQMKLYKFCKKQIDKNAQTLQPNTQFSANQITFNKQPQLQPNYNINQNIGNLQTNVLNNQKQYSSLVLSQQQQKPVPFIPLQQPIKQQKESDYGFPIDEQTTPHQYNQPAIKIDIKDSNDLQDELKNLLQNSNAFQQPADVVPISLKVPFTSIPINKNNVSTTIQQQIPSVQKAVNTSVHSHNNSIHENAASKSFESYQKSKDQPPVLQKPQNQSASQRSSDSSVQMSQLQYEILKDVQKQQEKLQKPEISKLKKMQDQYKPIILSKLFVLINGLGCQYHHLFVLEQNLLQKQYKMVNDALALNLSQDQYIEITDVLLLSQVLYIQKHKNEEMFKFSQKQKPQMIKIIQQANSPFQLSEFFAVYMKECGDLRAKDNKAIIESQFQTFSKSVILDMFQQVQLFGDYLDLISNNLQ